MTCTLKKSIAVGAVMVMLALSSGCSTIRGITMPEEENLLSGAGSIMVDKSSGKAADFEKIDLATLIESYGLGKAETITASPAITPEVLRYRRNELQDRLVAASNQRCGTFLRTLVSSKSQTQMGWGGLATFLSGAATITTPIAAARVLSAGSTISSSFLNLYNEAYFNNLTVNVISSGISKKREGLLQYISIERDKPLVDYTINRAIADALTYHAACNIVTGLEAAGTAINIALPTELSAAP